MAELVDRPVTATSPQRRFPAESFHDSTVVKVEAFGKHLLIDMSTEESIHVHLGMRGKWLRFSPVIGPLPQVRLRLATPDAAWDLVAPTRCEVFDRPAKAALISRLGPDPLRADADPIEARRRIASFSGSVGAALLDQSVVAGVGNVFRAEALHACRIAPTRPAGSLSADDLAALWLVLVDMMSRALDEGRIITVDADDRFALPEGESRRVYKRSACFDCRTPITTGEVGGRTAYWCPTCQPS
jgi:formamidopyrimidine-DNA glycosylase